MSAKFIAGLDIGTTKVSVVVGRSEAADLGVVGFGASVTSGMRKGMIVDIGAASRAVRRALDGAEKSSGVEIRSVHVGIAGSHLKCIDSYGATGIRGKQVTQRDVDRALEAASVVYVPLDRRVLHTMPCDYVIDGQEGIHKPIGMAGVRLEANVRVITAAQSAVDNLVQCCEMAGVKVAGVVYEAFASAHAVLRERELEEGVAVVDIGGGTTDVAVFKDGGLRHAAVLPVGGFQFTNDISVGLKLPYAEAERIKTEHGFAIDGRGMSGAFEATALDGSTVRVRRGSLGDILLPRAEELFEVIGVGINDALVSAGGSCVVLTGGASLLVGIDRVAEAKLGLPVRIGVPNGACITPEYRRALQSPSFATGVGLMLHAHDEDKDKGSDLIGIVMDGARGLADRLLGGGRTHRGARQLPAGRHGIEDIG